MSLRKTLRVFLLLAVVVPVPVFAQLQWSSANFIDRDTAEVGVGDFDKDGNVDIAIAGGIQRWYAGPDFTTFHQLGVSDGGPYAARVADINADGWLDFITSDGARTAGDIPGHLYVYLNPGETGPVTESWNRITVYTGNVRHQNDMRIADMDGDGRLDIIERTWSSERVLVALQNANINSWTVRTFDTGETGTPEGISAGDIDGDNEMEIVLSGVYWDNPGGWRTGNPVEYEIDANFVGSTYGKVKSAVGDINNDGRNDIYMGSAEGSDRYLAWYENTGNTTPEGGVELTRHIIKDNFGKAHMVQLIDIDQDGDLDLATGRSFGQLGLLIFYNNNNGDTWTEQNYDPTGEIYTGVVADLDKDGDLDVVGPSKFYRNDVRYYINESDVIPANPLAVDPVSLAFNAIGASQNVQIVTDVAWTASSNQGWLTISPENATGDTAMTVTAAAFNGFGNRSATVSVNNGDLVRTVAVVQQGIADVIAPSVPTGLQTENIDYDSFNLTWNASTDNSGVVTEYIVYLNDVEHSRVNTTNTLVSGLTELTNYSVTVSAVDGSSNESEKSLPAAVETPARPPAPPTVFYWKLNESNGTVATDSNGGNSGELSNPGGPVWTPGKFGNALAFDGAEDLVDLGTINAPLSAFTVSAWIRPDDIENHPEGRILSKASGLSESQHYWMLSTIKSGNNHVPRVRLKTGGTTTTLIGSQTVPVIDNNWFHILATYSDGELVLYNNGVDVGSTAKSGTVDQSGSVDVAMGNQPSGDRGFSGLLDDVCIFDFALSPVQVSEFYNEGTGYTCDTLPDGGATDTTPPVVTEITAVVSPTTDNTPRYVYRTSEAGEASYGGACAATPDASVSAGNVLLDFATLEEGTYSDCTVQVTDAANNPSNTLIVSSFTITAPDTTRPDVNINQDNSQADPTTSNIARFIIRFSEPVNPSTFTAADLLLQNTSGMVLEDPLSLAGSNGRDFQIQITGMTTGDTATVLLPADRVMDLAGNTNTVSTSTDNSVTYLCDNCDIDDDDGDGIADSLDNCVAVANPNQLAGEACSSEDNLCFPVVTRKQSIAMICL